ncbi:PorP/SprF family type IX secretion system membrane protein [Flavobacterium sp. MFBS3-15]|uniref:PorP/SprF family type IX secretion system membrane protein n=1 Tax=Flavobacterium sp. MFBS3-15 TaxID=2989816 RepID=UPI0022369422|nr:PorP/SprF family type IX secretion system membrane protein [Flavobacterium sp. MFBS3-15]MCW4470583.1 PorP/SprF family type IX secretion system membrane protein [Flavobacterium sp. MFBS3-15]
MKLKIAIIATFLGITANAQDPIFTQFFMAPQAINPGYTGFMETTTVGVLHRSQWPDNQLKINTDYAYLNTWSPSMNSGFGLNVLSQRESFTDYSLTQINGSYSYKVQLDNDWYFIPAIEAGWGTKSYGFQNLVLEDQLNIGSGTIDPTSIDPLAANNKVNFMDISAGMVVHNEKLWLGLSLKHLNKPNISFTQAGNIPLDMFMAINAGYEMRLSDTFSTSFLPHNTKMLFFSNFMKQAEYNRLDAGLGFIFDKVMIGAIAATNPSGNSSESHMLTSLNLYGGLQYEHFKFGYSYDFNTSGIGRTGGIHEFSISYQFDLEADCFGCPDY